MASDNSYGPCRRHRSWPYLHEEHLPAVFAAITPSCLELGSLRCQRQIWNVAEPRLRCVCQLHGGVKELLALAQRSLKRVRVLLIGARAIIAGLGIAEDQRTGNGAKFCGFPALSRVAVGLHP